MIISKICCSQNKRINLCLTAYCKKEMKILRKVLLRGKEFVLRISMLEEKGSRHQTDDISDLEKRKNRS